MSPKPIVDSQYRDDRLSFNQLLASVTILLVPTIVLLHGNFIAVFQCTTCLTNTTLWIFAIQLHPNDGKFVNFPRFHSLLSLLSKYKFDRISNCEIDFKIEFFVLKISDERMQQFYYWTWNAWASPDTRILDSNIRVPTVIKQR